MESEIAGVRRSDVLFGLAGGVNVRKRRLYVRQADAQREYSDADATHVHLHYAVCGRIRTAFFLAALRVSIGAKAFSTAWAAVFT